MAKGDFTEREQEMAARSYRGNELEYLRQVLAAGKLSSLAGGTFVPRFERAFADAIGARYAVAMNSCMSALHAALICADVGAGDEVICDPEFVFGALAGLGVVVKAGDPFVDPDRFVEVVVAGDVRVCGMRHRFGNCGLGPTSTPPVSAPTKTTF